MKLKDKLKNKIDMGDAVSIKIVLQDNILQEFSPLEDYILNPGLEEYITGQIKLETIKANLELAVMASKEQAETFSKALKKTSEQKILAEQKEIKRQLTISLSMLIAGILILVSGYFLKEVMLVYEIFLVASWVFIWRAVELFFFERQKRRILIIKKKILSADIKVKLNN